MNATFQRDGSFEQLFKGISKEDRAWLASEIYRARSSGGYVEYPQVHVKHLNTCIGLVNMAMDHDFNDEVDQIVLSITEKDRIEEEFGIEILDNIPAIKCICEAEQECRGLKMKREFLWDYRPRAKDIARGMVRCNMVLSVNMCDGHYWRVIDANGGKPPVAVGWDEWDALDGILPHMPRKRTYSQVE